MPRHYDFRFAVVYKPLSPKRRYAWQAAVAEIVKIIEEADDGKNNHGNFGRVIDGSGALFAMGEHIARAKTTAAGGIYHGNVGARITTNLGIRAELSTE